MSHTPAEGFEMIEAGQRNRRIVQIGSQRVSSALCAKAHELYQSGVIGDVEMVELTYGRKQPYRCLGLPATSRSVSRQYVLGCLVEGYAVNPAEPRALRPLALLERIWHRRRRRSHGPPH